MVSKLSLEMQAVVVDEVVSGHIFKDGEVSSEHGTQRGVRVVLQR